jgi:hypothetical protein
MTGLVTFERERGESTAACSLALLAIVAIGCMMLGHIGIGHVLYVIATFGR